jgi:hypothetical protein
MTGQSGRVDFTKTLAVLLDLLGEEVDVTVADRESIFVSGMFSGTLGAGQELLKGEFGAAEVVSFQVDGGGKAASFTLTSSDFTEAYVEDKRVTIHEGGVEIVVEALSHSKPLRPPHAFEESMPKPAPGDPAT